MHELLAVLLEDADNLTAPEKRDMAATLIERADAEEDETAIYVVYFRTERPEILGLGPRTSLPSVAGWREAIATIVKSQQEMIDKHGYTRVRPTVLDKLRQYKHRSRLLSSLRYTVTREDGKPLRKVFWDELCLAVGMT